MNDLIPLKVVPSNRFKRELRLMERRNKDLSKMHDLIYLLRNCELLQPRHRDHPLKGNWKGFRECHIEPDWLLIYEIRGNELRLERTGSHSDLF